MIAAIGEAGEGKSTLLNLILNSPGEDEIFFDVSDEPEACTISPTYRYESINIIQLNSSKAESLLDAITSNSFKLILRTHSPTLIPQI